ncbi:amidohydrolase family protein [Nitrospinota bacterium]
MRQGSIAVDMHTHYIPPAYLELVREEGNPFGLHRTELPSGEPALFVDNRLIPLLEGFHSVDAKLADIEAQGLDIHVLSPPPFLFRYELPRDRGAESARIYNDEARALAARWPDRFAAMATVPLQDPAAAAKELERAVNRLGMRSVEIGASAGERELDDPALAPFWEAAERLGVLVLIHPICPPGRERMNDYYLFNLIGFLVETTLAAARMIFAGVLDRYPDLRICLAHAGGMALWIQGRFDHGLRALPACQGNISRPPSEYLKRFYFDTITHRPEALRFVADTVGTDRILMGTDYPFAVADPDPVGTVAAVPGLTEEQRVAIRGGTVAALLNIVG